MSTPFTITKDNWNQLDKLEELRLAYSERHFCSSETGTFQKYYWNGTAYAWTTGDGTSADSLLNNIPSHGFGFNAQSVAFFYTIQNWLETNFPARPEAGAYNGMAVGSVQNITTFAKFCEATAAMGSNSMYASASDYGFRRGTIVNGSLVMSRGKAQAGDVMGAWLIDDLVLAFRSWLAKKIAPTVSGIVRMIESTFVNAKYDRTFGWDWGFFSQVYFRETVQTGSYTPSGTSGYRACLDSSLQYPCTIVWNLMSMKCQATGVPTHYTPYYGNMDIYTSCSSSPVGIESSISDLATIAGVSPVLNKVFVAAQPAVGETFWIGNKCNWADRLPNNANEFIISDHGGPTFDAIGQACSLSFGGYCYLKHTIVDCRATQSYEATVLRFNFTNA